MLEDDQKLCFVWHFSFKSSGFGSARMGQCRNVPAFGVRRRGMRASFFLSHITHKHMLYNVHTYCKFGKAIAPENEMLPSVGQHWHCSLCFILHFKSPNIQLINCHVAPSTQQFPASDDERKQKHHHTSCAPAERGMRREAILWLAITKKKPSNKMNKFT